MNLGKNTPMSKRTKDKKDKKDKKEIRKIMMRRL